MMDDGNDIEEPYEYVQDDNGQDRSPEEQPNMEVATEAGQAMTEELMIEIVKVDEPVTKLSILDASTLLPTLPESCQKNPLDIISAQNCLSETIDAL